MEQQVRVRRCNPDGTAEVVLIRQSACSGDCHKCSGCGAVEQTMVLTARNAIGAQAGDLVIIQSASGPVLAGAAVLYMLPLALFFLGYFLAAVLWEQGGWGGGAGFALGLVLAGVFDRRVTSKQNTEYTIVRYKENA